MNDYQLESLIKWLNTFDVKKNNLKLEDISDGVIISEILEQIAPEWFTISWKSKIKVDVGINWRLRVSNMKKIVEALMEYYSESLNQPLSGYTKPDAVKIGESCDVNQLRKLLQLVLGCAVNCINKQKYITLIMEMEETDQQAIMQNIQELESNMHGPRLSLTSNLNFESLSDVSNQHHHHLHQHQQKQQQQQQLSQNQLHPEHQLQSQLQNQQNHQQQYQYQKLINELHTALDLKDQLSQKCHELDLQLSLLQDEKKSLIIENKKIQERLEELDNLDHTIPSIKYSELRKQVEFLKDEIFKIEASRDDYRLRVELMEKEVFELQSKVDELQKISDEAITLKDEIDALRETADKAIKYESTIECYKKKMEDLSDLKRQIKILEDKNIELLQYKIDFEEEMKKSIVVRHHLELYKQQLTDCHQKIDEQNNNCDKLEFQVKKLEAKLYAAEKEKERLIIERDSLKEANEELKCSQLQTNENRRPCKIIHNEHSDDSITVIDTNNDLSSSEMKEKILFLEHENKMMKLQQSGIDDKLPTVQALLDDSEQRFNVLREQNRNANKKIMELENKLEQYLDNQSKEYSKDTIALHCQILQLQNESKQFQIDNERLILQIDEKDSIIQNLKHKITILQDNLTRKEDDNAALEDRYKKYIEKAKSVIRSLDPKQNYYPCELMFLRNQITEKHKVIDNMEKSYKESKLHNEMEEKLIISAFYHLGFNCQREVIDHRLAIINSAQGNSFLTRQRQSSARRNIIHSLYNSK